MSGVESGAGGGELDDRAALEGGGDGQEAHALSLDGPVARGREDGAGLEQLGAFGGDGADRFLGPGGVLLEGEEGEARRSGEARCRLREVGEERGHG